MGRFSVVDDDEEEEWEAGDDNNNNNSMDWEYCESNHSNVGALVTFTTSNRNTTDNNTSNDNDNDNNEFINNNAPLSILSHSWSPASDGTTTTTEQYQYQQQHLHDMVDDDDNMQLLDLQQHDSSIQQHNNYQHYQEPKQRQGRSPWFWYVAFIVIAHIVARYGPAAPPPPLFGSISSSGDNSENIRYNSWEEFLVKEISQLLTSTLIFGYQLPVYVSKWCLQGLYDDVTQLYEDMAYPKPPVCPLQLPSPDQIISKLSSTVVGQTIALEATTEALNAWDYQQDSSNNAPLLLYLVGGQGVGKTELSKQIASIGFGHCSDSGNNNKYGNAANDYTLTLQARDFVVNEYTTALQAKQNLYNTIINYLRNKDGAVIIIQHVEKLQEGLLESLSQDLKRKTSSHEDHNHHHQYNTQQQQMSYSPQLLPNLVDQCQKVIFIFTSNVGSKTIAKAIKSHGGLEQIPKLDLELALIHEIDKYYGADQDSRVASHYHAIAPFFPITKMDLKQIFLQKMELRNQQHIQTQTWKELIVTEKAVEAVLTQTVEYITIMKKQKRQRQEITTTSSDSAILLTFASTGGKVFTESSPVMNKLEAKIRQLSPQPSQKLIFDYDETTHMATFDWCPPDEQQLVDDDSDNNYNHRFETVTSHHHNHNNENRHIQSSSCSEACRFSL